MNKIFIHLILFCLTTLAIGQNSNTNYEILHTLAGHTQPVLSVNFSPDGSKIVSSSQDTSIRIWDANKGELIQTISEHTAAVASVNFSPDGSQIVSGSFDNSINLWNTRNGNLMQTLSRTSAVVLFVNFSPDGNKVVSSSYGFDNNIKIWDVSTGELLRTLAGHKDLVWSVNFSPDGNKIVSCSNDNSIKIWDAGTGKLIQTLAGHKDQVYSVNFNPGSNRIVSGGEDHSIKIWNVNNDKLLQMLTGHTAAVNSVNFSPDGSKIVSGSRDHSIKIWNANTGKLLQTLSGHTEVVESVNFSPDGSKIVSGSADNSIKIWRNIPLKRIDPEYAWLQPRKNTSADSNRYTVKLTISHPNKPITNVRLVHNGSVASTRDFEIVKNTNTSSCSKSITKEIVLTEGVNTIEFTFEVDGTEYTSSSRTITKLTSTNNPAIVTNPNVNNNEKRIALVIGNSIYDTGNNLPNPKNDADSISAVLQTLGFTVIKRKNLTLQQTNEIIRNFSSQLKNYDVGLFYYAGHGIEMGGNNYIIPVDAHKLEKSDVQYKCINTNWIQEKMAEAGSYNKTNIVILDACRNNPFRGWRSFSANEDVWVPPSNIPSGIITAYAASQGQKADDGNGTNGLYTSILLRHIRTRGQDIEQLFKRIRIELKLKGGQEPVEMSKLTKDFYFVPQQ